MKKIFIALFLCFVGYPMFAQLPFVSFQSVQADPVQRRPPVNNNTGSLYDPHLLSKTQTTQPYKHILLKTVSFIKQK